MSFRITPSITARTTLADVDAVRRRLASLQEQASSGRRVNRPSDDPVDYANARSLRGDLAEVAQFQRNITRIRSRVSVSESAIGSAQDVLIRARELAIQGSNGTLDAAARASLAQEVATLHTQLVTEANTRFGGAYVFSGYTSSTAPFTPSGPFVQSPPSSPSVAFVGDPNEVQADVGESLRVSTSLNGQRVFMGDGNGDSVPDAGKEDIFNVLSSLYDALMANNPTAVQATLPRLDTATNQLSSERTRLGATETQLDSLDQRHRQRSVDLETRLSQAQDADVARVYSGLAQEQTALQAALQATGRLVSQSLLDFLR